MAHPKVCKRPECSRPSAVEVTYIFGKGERYRMRSDIVCQKPEGVVERFVLCERHAAEAISGDDPPFAHTYFNKPKQVRILDETPRFSESWGVG